MPRDEFINRQVNRLISDNSPTTLMGARGLLRYNRIPSWLLYLIVIAIVGSWMPLAAAVRARFVRNHKPAVHLVLDMDVQPRYEAQGDSGVFANNMAMRPPIPGTVKRGGLEEDDFFNRGYSLVSSGAATQPEVRWYDGFPPNLVVDADMLARGKELFARYCYLCHGYDGYGYGPIHVRAQQRPADNAGWVQPSNLHDADRRSRVTGHIFNTVTNGIRTMGGYGHQIPAPEDRWAVVAYVKALQLSQSAPPQLIPAELREQVPVVPTLVGGQPFVPATQPAEGAGAGQPTNQ